MRINLVILLFFISSTTIGRTIIAGVNQPIPSLKKAIELAKDNDTILLQAGIYKEGSITLTKSLTIIGQNNPILDGEHKYEILLITGKNTSIIGLQFRNSGYSSMGDFAAIKLVDASNILLENNQVSGAYFAIHISNTSYVTVRNNTISRDVWHCR